MSDDEGTAQGDVGSTKEPALRQSRTTPWRKVGSDFMLAPLGTDRIEVLSGSGAVIWELLEEPATEAELVDALAESYEVPRDQIAGDTRALLLVLLQAGVVEEVRETDGRAR